MYQNSPVTKQRLWGWVIKNKLTNKNRYSYILFSRDWAKYDTQNLERKGGKRYTPKTNKTKRKLALLF